MQITTSYDDQSILDWIIMLVIINQNIINITFNSALNLSLFLQ